MLHFLNVSMVLSLFYVIPFLIQLLNHSCQGLNQLLVLHVEILGFSANEVNYAHEGVLDV